MVYRILLGVVCATLVFGVQSAAAQQPSAKIILAADVEGRFIVRNASQELIAEVYKPAGRPLTLNVEPGSYQVRVEKEKTTQIASVSVSDGAELVIDRRQLGPAPVESAAPHAHAEVLPYAVTSRNRFDFRFGAWSHGYDGPWVVDGIQSNVTGGIRYTRYFREDLAATFSIEGGGGQVGTVLTPTGSFDGVSGLARVPVGVRWNPLKFGRQNDGIKPFVAFSAGPVIGDSVVDYNSRHNSVSGIHNEATIGGFVGGGLDLHAGRTCVFGVEAGYNWMGDFGANVGGTNNYSGPTVSVNLGFMWGRGSTPRP